MVLFSLCDPHIIAPFLGHPHTVPAFCSPTQKIPERAKKKISMEWSSFSSVRHNLTVNGGATSSFYFLFVVQLFVIICDPCKCIVSDIQWRNYSNDQVEHHNEQGKCTYNTVSIPFEMPTDCIALLHNYCRAQQAVAMNCSMWTTE